MRSILLTLLLSLTIGTTVATAQTPPVTVQGPTAKVDRFETWRTFTSAESGFSVSLPGSPSVTSEALGSGPTAMAQTMYMVPTFDGRVFIIGAIESKEAFIPQIYQDGAIDGLVGAAESAGGKLNSRKEIVVGKCRGQELFLSEAKEGIAAPALGRVRVFASGNKLFLVYYTGLADTAAERAIAENFLASFSVTGGCVDTRPPGSKTSRINGTVDAATGWQRIDTLRGISFLFPSAPELIEERTPSPAGKLDHYTYGVSDQMRIYSVEIFDGFQALGKTPAASGFTYESILMGIKQSLAGLDLNLGAGQTLPNGPVPGREYQVSGADGKGIGRAQIYISPTRVFVVLGLEGTVVPGAAASDKLLLNRMFDSVRIDPK